MAWIARLNRLVGPVAVERETVDLLHWAADPDLVSNQPHRHTFYEACLSGPVSDCTFTHGGSQYQIGPRTLFCARPGVLHQIQVRGRTELRWVSFSLRGESAATSWSTRFRTGDATVTTEASLTAAVWNALETVNEGTADAVANALAGALIRAIAETLTPAGRTGAAPLTRGDGLVAAAIRFMEDNLDRPFQVADIARTLAVSERHLFRSFRAHLGKSPTEVVLCLRLDRARHLLRQPGSRVGEVAAAVGFQQVPYFVRRYRRRFGVTPGQDRDGTDVGGIVQSIGGFV